jgi:predicted RNase H-like HicB family nuclease
MTTVSPDFLDYPFEIRRLTEAEGGGFLITFPDLPGCMSDGETLEEAVANGKDASACWMIAHIEAGREIPHPGESRLVALVPEEPARAPGGTGERGRREHQCLDYGVSRRRLGPPGKSWC